MFGIFKRRLTLFVQLDTLARNINAFWSDLYKFASFFLLLQKNGGEVSVTEALNQKGQDFPVNRRRSFVFLWRTRRCGI